MSEVLWSPVEVRMYTCIFFFSNFKFDFFKFLHISPEKHLCGDFETLESDIYIFSLVFSFYIIIQGSEAFECLLEGEIGKYRRSDGTKSRINTLKRTGASNELQNGTMGRTIQSYRDFGRYVSREEKTAKYDKRLLQDGDERLLLRIVRQSPWLYIDEFQKLLYRATGVKYSYHGIRRVFQSHGLTNTKLERMARSRCHIEVIHFNSVIQTCDPECLIFLDESHVDDRDCRRRRGWSARGIKCYIREAFSKGNPVSVLYLKVRKNLSTKKNINLNKTKQ